LVGAVQDEAKSSITNAVTTKGILLFIGMPLSNSLYVHSFIIIICTSSTKLKTRKLETVL